MTEKDKPSVDDLIQRVDVLEEALDRMIAAFKSDLAALRTDLRSLEPRAATRPATAEAVRPRQAAGPKRTISEELAVQAKKRDPRTDD